MRKGDEVKEGDVVAVLEAMKMEDDIYANQSGNMDEVFIEEGDTVNSGENLII